MSVTDLRRVVQGMHISNTRHYYVETQIAAAGQTGAATLLHFLMRDDPTIPQWADKENVCWYIKLRHGWAPQGISPAPRRLVHVRMYHPNWTTLDARAWAEHTVEHLAEIKAEDQDGAIHGTYNLWYDPYICISAANEQNLHSESGDRNPDNQPRYQTVEWYEKLAAWNLEWSRRVDELVPDRKALLCWSALAYGHEPPGTYADAEYGIEAIREAIQACDIGASHPYGHLNWDGGEATVNPGGDGFYHLFRPFRPVGHRDHTDPGGELAQIEIPWLFTECGTFAHSHRDKMGANQVAMIKFLSACRANGKVLGATWFIGGTDDAHRDNNLGGNPDLLRWLAALEPIYTDADVPEAKVGDPGPVPLPEPLPDDRFDAEHRTDADAIEVLRAVEKVHEQEGVPLNPDAALWRAARVPRDVSVPTTNEVLVAGHGESPLTFIGQRYESEGDGAAVLFVQDGRWDRSFVVYPSDDTGASKEPIGQGIDVSTYQGEVDWWKAASRARWCYIRASYGTDFIDDRFEINWAGAKLAKISRGAYHVFYFRLDPTKQAEQLVRTLGGDVGELPPAVDVEIDEGNPDRLRTFLEMVEDALGMRPIIYTARWCWDRLPVVRWAPEYKLWVANYTVAPQPVLPRDWGTWWLWQYSSKGEGAAYGVSSEYVDLNRVNDQI